METMPHYAEADLQASESLRLIYTVADMHDLEKYNVNASESELNSTQQETTFMAYCMGAPANAKFNLEIYLNYEITVAPGSSFSGLTQSCSSVEDPLIVNTRLLQQKPDPVVTAIKGGISKSNGSQLMRVPTSASSQIQHSWNDDLAKFDPRTKGLFNLRYNHDVMKPQLFESFATHEKELEDILRQY